MKVKSANGFQLSGSLSACGDRLTVVAHKDDHEGRQTIVIHFCPDEFGELITMLRGLSDTGKDRRAAVRKAAERASGKAGAA